jgi:hypothetical protein
MRLTATRALANEAALVHRDGLVRNYRQRRTGTFRESLPGSESLPILRTELAADAPLAPDPGRLPT